MTEAQQTALNDVLEISEAVYRGVAELLPTETRVDSDFRVYSIHHMLNSADLSFLRCLSAKTKVQREHMDDHAAGAAGLWGLVDEVDCADAAAHLRS